MNAKEIEVRCPCCASHLLVDVRSGTILRASRPSEVEGEGAPTHDVWDQAQQRVRDRSLTGAEKLEKGLEEERTKEARFDDLFRKASEKHARKKEE